MVDDFDFESSESDVTGDGFNRADFTLSQRYDVKEHLYATRTSEAFRAVEKATGEFVVLWVLRHPLAQNSDSPEIFRNRVERLTTLSLACAQIRSYGIDSSGKPFVATDYVQGMKFSEVPCNSANVGKYFCSAIDIVARIHKAGLNLGDICEDSFIITPDGSVCLIALMGTFDVDAAKTALLPQTKTLNYLSPEQKMGYSSDTHCDVYALGVLGYRLFTGRYLAVSNGFVDPGSSPSPSLIVTQAPIWLDDVIGMCLAERIEDRYKSAEYILEAIDHSVSSGMSPGGMGCWSRRTVIVRPDTTGRIRASGPSRDIALRDKHQTLSEPVTPTQSVGSSLRRAFLLGGFAFVIGTVIAAFILLFSPSRDGVGGFISPELGSILKQSSPSIQKLGSDFLAATASVEQRMQALENISLSDDKMAFPVLLAMTASADKPELRRAGEQYLLRRVRENKLKHSAEVLSSWFMSILQSTAQEPSKTPGFSLLLTACNILETVNTRRLSLFEVHKVNPQVALQLTAALCLDSENESDFSSVLRSMLEQNMGGSSEIEKLKALSTSALILADKSLSMVFARDISSIVQKLTGAELAWALVGLAQRNDTIMFDIARETLSRNIVPPFQSVFLKALVQEKDPFSIPKHVRLALAKGAKNEITEADVSAIGLWYSISSEKPLLAVCALSPDIEIATKAFDTLATKSIGIEPAYSLIRWIKNNRWDKRRDLVKAVGILGHSEIATKEQIEYAFDVVMPHAGLSFFSSIIDSNDVGLLTIALERFSEVAPLDQLLALLKHPSTQIRISAIKALKGQNNLLVLRSVLRAYEQEKDTEVKEHYRANFFVVRDRGN